MPEKSSTKSAKSRFFDIALIFAAVYLLSTFAMRTFFPKQETKIPGVYLQMQALSVREGATPEASIENATTAAYALPARCPRPPLDIFRVGTDAAGKEVLTPVVATGALAVPCETDIVQVPAGETVKVPLSPWKYSVFGARATYEVRLPQAGSGAAVTGSGTMSGTARLTIYEPGSVVKLWRALFIKPFLNFLIFAASVLPGHNLGIAIILLTLLVKLLLFYPTQKSLEGQKKMQLIQPKLEEVRKKYKDDPKRQQEETVKLWKEHKINPFQSCAPLLFQFPILIGLLHVIQEGSYLALSQHLVYPAYQNLEWTFGTGFLGLDLLEINYWIFPPLLVVMQFIQMWLSFRIADRKKAKQIEKIEHGGVQTKEKSAQEIQQQVMLYVLPLMIGFFAIRFPAAVALYWGVSTLFAIGQQLIVNREHLRV